MSLIDRLNTHVSLTPDEIVEILNDPFPTWRCCNTMSQTEYEAHGLTRIVLAHVTYNNRITPQCVELYHVVGDTKTDEFPEDSTWSWSDWQSGTLSTSMFWFRSRKSFDKNQYEGFRR